MTAWTQLHRHAKEELHREGGLDGKIQYIHSINRIKVKIWSSVNRTWMRHQ